MRNKDINEWLLDVGIDPNIEITGDGKQWVLSDILVMHLKEQFAIQRVSKRSELFSCPKCGSESIENTHSDKQHECLYCGYDWATK